MDNDGFESLDELRLSAEEQSEIGEILVSARLVARQMITLARQQSDEIMQTARDRAEQIVQDAEEKAEKLLREAEEEAARKAHSEQLRMQDYAVRCVGDCFSRLRQQQLETVDFINDQWRDFLSGITFSDEQPVEDQPTPAPSEEITRQDIEARVSEIAKELMGIIGN